jgi:hypothetical protein
MKHGFNPWTVVTVALVSVVGCGVFYVYQQNAVYNAESRAFYHGVNTAHEEAARAQAENLKAVVI